MNARTPPSDAPAEKIWRTAELLRWIRDHLSERGVDSPRVCAELLLSSVFACDRLRLYMEPQRPASEEERSRLRELVARAARREPVQHLVGEGWFFSRPFFVGPEVLVPRPATETLVSEALGWIRARSAETTVSVLDLGTGSGCIGITLALDARTPPRRSDLLAERVAADRVEATGERTAEAGDVVELVVDHETEPGIELETEVRIERERKPAADATTPAERVPTVNGPSIEVVATDLESGAIEIARRNAVRHEVSERVEFAVGDLFAPVSGRRFDLICANPPYIDDARWAEVPANVRFEPESALRGGADGLAVLRRLIAEAPTHLAPGGAIVLEFQFDQAERVRALLEAAGFTGISIVSDHEGHDRVAFASRPA